MSKDKTKIIASTDKGTWKQEHWYFSGKDFNWQNLSEGKFGNILKL